MRYDSMWKIIKLTLSYLSRGIKSASFGVSVLLCVFVLLGESSEIIFNVLRGQRYASDQIENLTIFSWAFQFGYIAYAVPLIACFASQHMFCDDNIFRFRHQATLRLGKRAYRYGVWLGTTLCGGLAVFLGIVLYSAFITLVLPTHNPLTEIARPPFWQPLIAILGGWPYMLIQAVLGLLFGMVCSGMGIAASAKLPNRYVASIIPFLLVFVFDLITQSLMAKEWSLLEEFSPMLGRKYGFWGPFLEMSSLYAIVFLVFRRNLKRRQENE